VVRGRGEVKTLREKDNRKKHKKTYRIPLYAFFYTFKEGTPL
jgi:hypothetical protein